MSPEETALRDAFLAECWAPVREWHPTDAERAAAWARTQAYAHGVDDTPEAAKSRAS